MMVKDAESELRERGRLQVLVDSGGSEAAPSASRLGWMAMNIQDYESATEYFLQATKLEPGNRTYRTYYEDALSASK